MEMLYGTGYSGTLRMLLELGKVLLDQGRYKSMEEAIRRSLDVDRSTKDYNQVYRLDALDLLGQTLRLQGCFPEALKLYVRVLTSRKTLFGSEHPSTLRSMGHLASTYRIQGRWKEAEVQ